MCRRTESGDRSTRRSVTRRRLDLAMATSTRRSSCSYHFSCITDNTTTRSLTHSLTHPVIQVHVPTTRRTGRLQRTPSPCRHRRRATEAGHDVSRDVRDDVRIVGRPAAHYRHADLCRYRLHRLPGPRAHERIILSFISSVIHSLACSRNTGRQQKEKKLEMRGKA